MRKNFIRIAVVGILLATVGLTATACSTQTTTADCGLVIGAGAHEAHTLKKVVYPGDSVGHQGDDWVKFIPCGPRNYVVTDDKSHGDRHTSAVGLTAPSSDGTPGVSVNVWFTMYWTPNESKQALTEFWVMCQKYTCASDDQNNNSDNNSTKGWNSMLREVMSDATNRAVADALVDAPQDIWYNRGEWPALITKIENNILAEERASTKTSLDMFCDDASDTKAGKPCGAPTFTIENITPVDPTLVTIRANQVASQASAANNDQRIANAHALYGPNWYLFLEYQDIIAACQAAGQTCTIVLGSNPVAVGGK